MTDFNTLKRQIPPGRLPDVMKDHKLEGRLDGIRECHLAPDVLLLYAHEDDVPRYHMILARRLSRQLSDNLA